MRDLEPATDALLPERALAALDVALVTTDERRRITSWSAGAERIFGFTAEQALGLRADELPVVTGALADATRQALSSAPRSWLEQDLPLLRSDGSSFPARLRLAMVHDPDGRVAGSVAMITDTSSPRASRVELAFSPSSHGPLAALGRLAITGIEREELLARTASTIRDCLGADLVAVLRCDPASGEIRIEAGCGWEAGVEAERFGPDEPHLGALIAGRVPVVELELPEGREPERGLLARHGIGSGVSVSLAGPQGPDDPAALAAFSRRRRRFGRMDIDFLQAVANVLTAAADRARARELERRLERLSRIEAIGQLTGGIAHDFNNLLSVILNNVSFAREEAGGEAGADPAALREIEAAASRAAELTHQLLVFSRREVAELRPTSVAAALESLRATLARELGSGIELRLDIVGDLPPVKAGPGQLEQIVINLAANAREAMPAGGMLSIRAAGAGGSDARWARIEVADEGEGMSREVIAKAFDPFFTTKPAGRGAGLGLATVHGIVSSLGGSVELRSEPGEGTTVDVLLPACEPDPDPEQPSPQGGAGPGTRPAPPPDRAQAGGARPGVRVLLVEDDPLVRRLAFRVLEEGGHAVVPAAGPDEALGHIRRGGGFDLVLCDVEMPQMSGVDLAAEIRSELPGIRVVLMSGYTGESLPGEMLRDGDVCFVEKPFTPETLLAGIAGALEPS